MGSALIGGLIKNGWYPGGILVIDPSAEKRAKLSYELGIQVAEKIPGELASYPVIVWAVKPQEFDSASQNLSGLVGNALHVSIMAGITTERIMKQTGSARIVRSMPNSPALVGAGVAGVYARPEVSESERVHAEALLASTSTVVWFEDEAHLDAVTAISGSGPAYVFYLMEAMLEAAMQMGLAPDQARRLVNGTLLGAAQLADASTLDPATLRQQVTSKGGTTHAAVTVLDENRTHDVWVQALHAACKRAEELGRS